MPLTLQDILEALETLAPMQLAENWDNVGLQLGHRGWTVRRIMVALDPTLNVVEEAARREADLVVTHHPLFLKTLRAIDCATPTGAVVERLLTKRIGLVAAHTNLDSVRGGVNDALAEALDLQDVSPLQPVEGAEGCGLGRIGRLKRRLTMSALALEIKNRLQVSHLRVVGAAQLEVVKVAICSGSGASLMDAFFSSEAEAFITGDVRYHDAREVEARQRGLIDVGHFESEHLAIKRLAERLHTRLAAKGWALEVITARAEETPFRTI